jgi:hypothetical protein
MAEQHGHSIRSFPAIHGGITLRRILLVYLKDTFYAGGGAAQWHYNLDDADQLQVKILASGSLAVFMPDPENGVPNAHLGGERAREVAFFPAGGWSGYAWEMVPDEAVDQAKQQQAKQRLAASGIAIP